MPGVKTGVRHLPLPESCDLDDAAYVEDELSTSSDDESDYSDNTDDADDFQDGSSTPMTESESNLEYPPPPSQRPRKSLISASNHQNPAIVSQLPEYSDDPDDNTDEDIAKVPLDFGRSKFTRTRTTRIEERWHK